VLTRRWAARYIVEGTTLWINLWIWWQGTGTPAAAIQQLSFIVFTGIATVVGLRSLSTWKRQRRGEMFSSAVTDVLNSAALVSEHILIERLSPLPMVVFKDLKGFNRDWQTKAIAAIDKERAEWAARKKELDERVTNLKLAMQKNDHLLADELKLRVNELLIQVQQYAKAIDARVKLIGHCAHTNTEAGYQPMIGLAALSRQHPLLWRKERNLESVQFEGNMRRAIDALRQSVAKVLSSLSAR
jgi:hypothetical protein